MTMGIRKAKSGTFIEQSDMKDFIFCASNTLKKLNFNEHFLKLTYKFDLKTQAYKMGHKIRYFETFCLRTRPHSK